MKTPLTLVALSSMSAPISIARRLAAVSVVPIFFNVYSSRVFEPDKITLLRSFAVLMAVAWTTKTLEQGLRTSPHESGERVGVWRRLVAMPLVLPTLALISVYLLSTLLSVVPRTSLVGSYQRLQGTYSTLSYVVIFGLMLQGVRSRAQVERFVTTVVLTSAPIALYGILQHYGLDPLPWGGDVTNRIASNLGNAIFVSAYIIMVTPLVLYRIIESFTAILTDEELNVQSEVAVLVQPDGTTFQPGPRSNIERAIRQIEGTARSMGITITD